MSLRRGVVRVQKVVKTSVAIPLNLYTTVYVLVREGEFINMRHAIVEALREYLRKYDSQKIDQLKRKYATEIKAIEKRAVNTK